MTTSSSSRLWPATAAAVATGCLAVAALYVYRTSEEEKTKEKANDDSGGDEGTKNFVQRVVAPPPLAQIEVQPDSHGDSLDHHRKRILSGGCITIVHGSMTGTCARFAEQLYTTLERELVQKNNVGYRQVQVGSIEEWDWWDELLNDDDGENADDNKKEARELIPLLIVLIPTYTAGTWPPSALSLETALKDLQHDWRVEKSPLAKKLKVAVFGTGSSAYNQQTTTDDSKEDEKPLPGNVKFCNNMGQPAREASRQFSKLGARSITKVQVGDDAVGNHAQDMFDSWRSQLLERIDQQSKKESVGSNKLHSRINGKASISNSKTSNGCKEDKKEGECCRTEADHGDCCDKNNELEDEEEDEAEGEPEVMDLEDMGDSMLAASQTDDDSGGPREMVTPSQAAALKKEGYRLIGSHSAVKLCRWTKHQLRGRGGCYKHTFYGITSYQCMEATPSLACANKCVFCWRHHKNPVGKEWKWKTDDPHFIVDQAVQTHIQMIKETKGIPGVQLDRWKEAHTVRHCALSLVGEPIMYPRIDELLADLHSRKISTFLVTNGQHPDAIESLRPVTQLYVSVDAPTQESLIAVDRPLFSDAWDRLKRSLSFLKDKGQRTVARLTVVKGWNSDEAEGYAKLIVLGRVSLVEIKGVTFCGKSDASNLNMSNSPWHHEVIDLAKNLKKEIDRMRREEAVSGDPIPEYELACEHKHSVSVLLARVDQFATVDPVTGKRKWCTWINYDKFQELVARNAEDPSFTFAVQDYTEETPSWALFGSEEEGFDPTDTRHRKKQKHPMYSQFDERGVPTHDHNNVELAPEERSRLVSLMEEKLDEIGSGSTVTELRDGSKEILDASNYFRGMVVAK